ncbi:hypothetical protein [Oligoflexus tunisiensis]|uniref:hypothetical protein n=1 Tax=Oligoflexus tunisiensis TaxID=708132 RepID=UPI00114CF04C|nr:hypothetical protein [Oligoflexus tunisiensis]
MLYRMLHLIILPLFILACEALKNRTDHIAIECGIPQDSVGQNSYIKLLRSSDTGYVNSDLPSIKVRFLQDKGEDQPIAMTPRACLQKPSEAGLLQVVDTRNGESLTKRIEPTTNSRNLLALNLSPKPEFQAFLACPDEGIFASETLKQPLFVNTSEVAGLDIRLDLFTHENNLIKTLFRKPMGQTDLGFPDSIDIRDVSEGSYLLKIYGHHISDGIDSRPLLLSSEKICKFHILRGEVYVSGLDASTKQLVFPPRARLPWGIQNSFEKLFACRESRSKSNLAMSLNRETCQPQNACSDPANFKEVSQISTESSTGIFDYFVYVENKAGKRSSLSCQTVIVSDTPPTLAVTWAHDDLKKPGSILRQPYAILRADIETSHNLLSNPEIEINLQCKVDFEIKGENTYSENKVLCTEGRCEGKSLADFVPCDKHVAFTLVDVLNQPMVLSSRLRLTVRSTDGAGHTAEGQASVWINQSTWVKDIFDFTIDDTPLSLIKFRADPSGDLLGTFSGSASNELATFVSGRWIGLKPDERNAFKYHIATALDGSLRIARLLRYDDKFKVDIYGYKYVQLVPIATTSDDNLIPTCSDFHMGPNETAYCMGININQIFQLIGNKWVQLPLATAAEDPAISSYPVWKVLSNGNVAATTAKDLFTWDGRSWTRTALGLDIGPHSSPDIIEDFKGRLWIYVLPREKDHGLFKVELSKLVHYPSPAPLPKFNIGQLDANEFIKPTHFVADMHIFSFSTDQWETMAYPLKFLADMSSRNSIMNNLNQTFVLLEDKGFIEKTNELLYWPVKSFGMSTKLLWNSAVRVGDSLYFIEESLSKHRLSRIRPTFISSFDSSMTGSSEGHINGAWSNAEGKTVLNFSDGTQLKIHEDHIEKLRAPAIFQEALQVTALASDRFCVSSMSGLWLYNAKSGQSLNFATDLGTGRLWHCTEDALGHLWWFDFVDNTVNIFNGQGAYALDFQFSEGEKILSLNSIANKSKLLIATNQRIIIFDLNEKVSKVISLQEIASTLPAVSIKFVVKLNDSEILLETLNNTNQRLFFSVNLETTVSTPETEFKKINGEFGISRSAQWQDKSYILTSGPRAVIIQRANGKWKKLGNLNDFKHISPQKEIKPWWFTVDNFDRIWFVTNGSPYKLGRLDPEWVP